MANRYQLVHLKIDKDDYEALKSIKSLNMPSISFMIRTIIHGYLHDNSIHSKPGLNISKPVTEAGSVEGVTQGGSVKNELNLPRGVQLHHLIAARRAKRNGRDYDHELEKYFPLLDNLSVQSQQNG
jgi:hypothetical protein